MPQTNKPIEKKKLLDYFEKHPIMRTIFMLSAVVGLAVSVPIIINLFKRSVPKTELAKPPHVDSTNYKEYFIPTHYICITDSSIVFIRNRSLTLEEMNDINTQTKQANILDGKTNIGQLGRCAKIKILDKENSFLKIQYWDGTRLIVGYIPDDIQLQLIKPKINNPYGLGNGQISIYTTLESGIENIYLDDKLVGTINYYQNYTPKCDDNNIGLLKLITKAGEHLIKGEDVNGYTWEVHVTLSDGNCELINLSD